MMMTPKSGLFLASCCIAAIASVGSVFELTSGHPQLGDTPTRLILIASIPLVIILFVLAIRNSQSNP